jgi:signal transduction histidine kinase
MRERVEGLGGRYHLESAPGRGTCVNVTLPLIEAARSVAAARAGSGA